MNIATHRPFIGSTADAILAGKPTPPTPPPPSAQVNADCSFGRVWVPWDSVENTMVAHEPGEYIYYRLYKGNPHYMGRCVPANALPANSVFVTNPVPNTQPPPLSPSGVYKGGFGGGALPAPPPPPPHVLETAAQLAATAKAVAAQQTVAQQYAVWQDAIKTLGPNSPVTKAFEIQYRRASDAAQAATASASAATQPTGQIGPIIDKAKQDIVTGIAKSIGLFALLTAPAWVPVLFFHPRS